MRAEPIAGDRIAASVVRLTTGASVVVLAALALLPLPFLASLTGSAPRHSGAAA